jgi:hypothetical protein
MPSNQWGPFVPNTGASAEPVYPPSATPDPTGDLDPPQSPSGSVTGESGTYNFDASITSTENFLRNELQPESAQQGVAALESPVTIAGCPSVQQNAWTAIAVTPVTK